MIIQNTYVGFSCQVTQLALLISMIRPPFYKGCCCTVALVFCPGGQELQIYRTGASDSNLGVMKSFFCKLQWLKLQSQAGAFCLTRTCSLGSWPGNPCKSNKKKARVTTYTSYSVQAMESMPLSLSLLLLLFSTMPCWHHLGI